MKSEEMHSQGKLSASCNAPVITCFLDVYTHFLFSPLTGLSHERHLVLSNQDAWSKALESQSCMQGMRAILNLSY